MASDIVSPDFTDTLSCLHQNAGGSGSSWTTSGTASDSEPVELCLPPFFDVTFFFWSGRAGGDCKGLTVMKNTQSAGNTLVILMIFSVIS